MKILAAFLSLVAGSGLLLFLWCFFKWSRNEKCDSPYAKKDDQA